MSMDLIQWIKNDEGLKLHPYLDSLGICTIGYGRNLKSRGITQEEAQYLLLNDIKQCKINLSNFHWYVNQPPGVRNALVNMCFNLGLSRLLKFKNMIKALENKDYDKAANEALNSKWANQVKNRAARIANVIRDGQ